VTDKDTCPLRVTLLNMIVAGEHSPHLDVCEECAEFVAAATDAVTAFADRGEVERAVAASIDAVLADAPARHWTSVIVATPELRRSVVIRELVRRAYALDGSNPRLALDLTTAAVAVCDAMVASGHAPSMELRFLALKEHSIALHRMGRLDDAIVVLGRAWPIASRTKESERDRAILSLCAAIVYAEPDIADFDAALEFAETAASVLAVYGDERRAIIARQTKAYVLLVMHRFAEALPLLQSVTADLDEATGESRDAALAHTQLAECLVEVGMYEEAQEHASTAERLHLMCGGVIDVARATHIRARAVSALGQFADVRSEFTRAGDVVFDAKMFDTWAIMRLEYVAAALADDEGANVRTELESVMRVCMTLNATGSTQRQAFAAEALDYLRQLAIRDALTSEAVDHVRSFVIRNTSQPPVKFTRPSSGTFLM
jgi:tetratricopeptide (TPR) repeat protein